MQMKTYPCVYMRGGTSKAVIFHKKVDERQNRHSRRKYKNSKDVICLSVKIHQRCNLCLILSCKRAIQMVNDCRGYAKLRHGKDIDDIGNNTIHSDGTSSTRIGNNTINSNGTSSTRIGDSTLHSDGTTCTTVYSSTICN